MRSNQILLFQKRCAVSGGGNRTQSDCSALGTFAHTLWDCLAASSKCGKIENKMQTALMLYFQNPSKIFGKKQAKDVNNYLNFYGRRQVKK